MSVVDWDRMPEPWATWGPGAADRVRRTIEGYPEPPKKGFPVSRIKVVVAEYFSLATEDLASYSHQQTMVRPRLIAMYLARQITGRSYVSIAQSFGRDHQSVMSAERRVRGLCEHRPEFAADVARIRARLLEAQHDAD